MYVTGSFADTADFDPSGNTANLISNGIIDIFIAKYDANGNYNWASNVGGTGDDVGWKIAIDPTVPENVCITGHFQDTADFDPSGNTANLISNGSYDIFVAKYSQSAPVAGFTVSNDTICENDCIDFIDVSTSSPTNWIWYFPGGTPATSTAQNPSNICYNTAGIYDVSLKVSNLFGTDSITSTNHLTVEICLGEKEITYTSTFTIYPNPTEGKFEVASLEFGVKTIEMYDLFGRKVLSTTLPEIDMRGYAKGVYFIRVGEVVRKLVLQ